MASVAKIQDWEDWGRLGSVRQEVMSPRREARRVCQGSRAKCAMGWHAQGCPRPRGVLSSRTVRCRDVTLGKLWGGYGSLRCATIGMIGSLPSPMTRDGQALDTLHVLPTFCS